MHALILDYGEVLSLPQAHDVLPAMAIVAGAAAYAFSAAYWHHRRAYDLGLPAADYWATVVAEAGGRAQPDIAALIDLDVRSWTRYRRDVWRLSASARAAGLKTAILSNGVPEVMAKVRHDRPLDTLFDAVVVSCEVGSAKPDPAIYRLTLARLGVEPFEALFVDDRAENITAAADLGLETLHFTGEAAMARLRAILTPELSK